MKNIVLLFAIICSTSALQAQAVEDTFRFRNGSSRVVTLMLAEAGGLTELTWPDAPGPTWDTALLSVRVDASADAATPFVEIAAGGKSDRQYFRPGDAGTRWLNLSFLQGAINAGTRVTLRGEGVKVAVGDATLRVFANAVDLSRSILVLAPHPDDAEIAAFGLYAFRRSTIVTITTGNAGPRSYQSLFSDPAELYHFKGRIRLIDSITVPWLGGIAPDRTFNMGYFDARLADMHESPDKVIPEMYSANTDIGAYLRYNIGALLPKRSRNSTWKNLVDDLERVLKTVKPAVIVAPHPQLDTHRDHQFTAVALAEALTRWKRNVTLLLYTNHADQNRYPYGPPGSILSLPPPLAADVVLDRVYSHSVSLDLQRMKLFALESMHDLRPSPSRLYQIVTGEAVVGEVDPPGGVSYLRRGPRSNEIFFVYDQHTLRPMLDAFMTAWRARQKP